MTMRAVLLEGRSWCCRAFLRQVGGRGGHLECDACGAVNGSAAFASEEDALMSEHYEVPLCAVNIEETPVTEKQIQNAILRAFATRGDMRLWRANAGEARYGAGPHERSVKFGVKGQADLSGILRGGTRLEIEVKTQLGCQSEEQKSWQRMIERFGGVYVLARSVQDVAEALAPYLAPPAKGGDS